MFGPSNEFEFHVEAKRWDGGFRRANPWNVWIWIGLIFVLGNILQALSSTWKLDTKAPEGIVIFFGILLLIGLFTAMLVHIFRAVFPNKVYTDSEKIIEAALESNPNCVEKAIQEAALNRLKAYALEIQAIESHNKEHATKQKGRFKKLFDQMQRVGFIEAQRNWGEFFESTPESSAT